MIKVCVNHEMKCFITDVMGENIDIQHWIEKKMTMRMSQRKITKYKVKFLKTKSKQFFCYTKMFNLKYNLFWKRRPLILKDEELSKYEWEGNELFFFERDNKKSNFKKAILIFVYILLQLHKKSKHKFCISMSLSDVEDEKCYVNGGITIRFYEIRGKVDFVYDNYENTPMLYCKIN